MSAWAQLGETSDECAARYGSGRTITPAPLVIDYLKGGFFYTITFGRDGRAEAVSIQQAPVDPDGMGAPIADEAMQGFLKSNSDGSEWLLITDKNENPHWKSEKGERTANYDIDKGTLWIADKQGMTDPAAKSKAGSP